MYHKSVNGQPVGPMSLEDLVGTGLGPDTLVWKQGAPAWVRASELPELAAVLRGENPVPLPPSPVGQGPQGYGAQGSPRGPAPVQGGKMNSVGLLILSILTSLIGLMMLMGFLFGMGLAAEEFGGGYRHSDEYGAVLFFLVIGVLCSLVVIIQSILGIVVSVRKR